MSDGAISTICAPALVYLSFSLVQIIIDVYKLQFYTAFFKFWTMLIITMLLNILCERGLGAVSWFFVFIPIITMTVMLVILIYFIGFNPGQINKKFNVKAPVIKPHQQNIAQSYNINDIIRREIALQKKIETDNDVPTPNVDTPNVPTPNVDTPNVEEIIKINESFTDNNKQSNFLPAVFI
jgi:hypothetical protein